MDVVGFYLGVHVDAARMGAVSQAGGVLLTEILLASHGRLG